MTIRQKIEQIVLNTFNVRSTEEESRVKEATNQILKLCGLTEEPKDIHYPCHCLKPRNELNIDKNGFCSDCKIVVGNWKTTSRHKEKLEEAERGYWQCDGTMHQSTSWFADYSYCPICGRPKPKSKEERLAKVIENEYNEWIKDWIANKGPYPQIKFFSVNLAQAALQWMEKEK